MNKNFVFKIAILILSIIVAIETTALLKTWLKKPKKALQVSAPLAAKPRIAIVLDDWGYNLSNLRLAAQIHYPLTMSVLPNLRFSREAADELSRLGFEVILHLPLEPYEKFRLENKTIMTSMKESEIISILVGGLASVPYAKGISNHMGSRATENISLMKIIFKELSKRNLYFLDSLVSGKSVCSVLAKESEIPFARRDVFLDNQENPEYILGQIHHLKTKARMFGSVIGIGHARKITLETLKEVMPQLEKEGFKFVFVSELVE